VSLPWRQAEDGLELAIRLTPKAGQNRIDGIGQDPSGKPVLLVRVTALPVDGAANKALLKFLAKSCGIAKSNIRFISGETSRIKRLHITGDTRQLTQYFETQSR